MTTGQVFVFASVGQFADQAALDRYVEVHYDPDGNPRPSPFMNDVDLEDWEPSCLEVVWEALPRRLSDLLGGVSYDDQWLSLVDVEGDVSEAICAFTPNRPRRPEGCRLRFVGCFEYRP